MKKKLCMVFLLISMGVSVVGCGKMSPANQMRAEIKEAYAGEVKDIDILHNTETDDRMALITLTDNTVHECYWEAGAEHVAFPDAYKDKDDFYNASTAFHWMSKIHKAMEEYQNHQYWEEEK